jgi:hypothetical protein
MNKFLCWVAAGLIPAMVISSCKKYSLPGGYPTPPSLVKVKFQLYTTKDFSEDDRVIQFSLFIRRANNTLFDSALAPMKLKDIPDSTHKLVFEKSVFVNPNVNLTAGFHYEIPDVGNSSFLDTLSAGNTFKLIDYNFQ